MGDCSLNPEHGQEPIETIMTGFLQSLCSSSDRLGRAVRRAALAASRFRPAGVVLAYHRVGAPKCDPQLLSVSPDRFSAHLEVMRRLGECVSLRNLVRGQAIGRLAPRAIVVTFDDGYADNLTFAEPLLRRAGVPATVFLTAGGTEIDRTFWWDELEMQLLRRDVLPERLVVTIGDQRLEWCFGEGDVASRDEKWDVTQLSVPSERYSAYLALFRLCRALPATQRRRVLDQVAVQLGAPLPTEDHRRLSPSEIAQLGRSPWIELGAHGVTHTPLAAMTAAEQAEEIRGAKAAVTQMGGAPVDLFSYPFGSRADLTDECAAMVRACGFMAACANWPGRVLSATDPYRLPRFLVRDWTEETFAAMLNGWLQARQPSLT